MEIYNIFLLFVVVQCTNGKSQCGQQSHSPIINGDFANIRKNAVYCEYSVGNNDSSMFATVSLTEISLDEEDYFYITDEDEITIYDPYYGDNKPFAIVTNKQVTVIIHNQVGYTPKFRVYVKTHKLPHHYYDYDETETKNETFYYGFKSNREKRQPQAPQPPKCNNIILKDIFYFLESGELLRKIQDWKLIPKDGELNCGREGCEGKLHIGAYSQAIDKYRWICRAKIEHSHRRATYCGEHQSLRRNSFFFKSKLEIWQIVVFVNLWIRKVPLWVIEEQSQMSHPTAVDWSSYCREVAFDAMVKLSTKIGGEGIIVEIDESKFGKRKYNKGHVVQGAWVFGGVERKSGKLFMEVVPDRSAKTLIALIEKWIEPGTTIYSDQRSSYKSLTIRGYKHMTVNHHLNFKYSKTGVHTNSIESIWGHAKENVPKRGRKVEFLAGYLARYMLAKRADETKSDPMLLFFEYARRLYNPAQPVDIEVGDEDPVAGPSGDPQG